MVKLFACSGTQMKMSYILISLNSSTSYSSSKDKFHSFENMISFLNELIMFRYLLVNHRERRIVIVESILCPTEFREVLAKVLFIHFEVIAFLKSRKE